MDPQKITELAKLLRNNGDKILTSEFKLKLSGVLLRALNDSFTLIADSVDIGNTQETFQVVKPINSKSPVFPDLQLIHDFVQKTSLLCIVHYAGEESFEGSIDINKFRALKRLEVHKTNIKQVRGIQPLRSRLQHLVCVKSLQSVEDIITRCGGDNSNGFVWNELKIADFSYNNLQTIDTSLEFAQYLQHLNLRHNKLKSVSAIKWLPHLKSLDLSFNCLQCIPQFHVEACKRLQSLNMSNNFLEDIIDVSKLDVLIDLDLSENCLMEHSSLLPLSALMTLSYLNLTGNPLHCHPKHRLATSQYLHSNTATVKFILDLEPLTKSEKSLVGKYQGRYVRSLNRLVARSSSSSINSDRRTPSYQTPASSVDSLRSFKFQESSTDTEIENGNLVNSSKKRSSKIRTVDIKEPLNPPLNEEERQKAADESKLSKQKEINHSLIKDSNSDHLEAKKQVEILRKKYGAEWLQNGKAEMVHNILGTSSSAENVALEHEKSRKLLQDYLGELSLNNERNSTMETSTPTNDSYLLEKNPIYTPIKHFPPSNDPTIYMSFDNNNSFKNSTNGSAFYKSADSGLSESHTNILENPKVNLKPSTTNDDNDNPDDTEHDHLHNIYSSINDDDESEVSEPEDDEDFYVVHNANKDNESIILTLSSKYLREKSAVTQRTLSKWSLQILESCDRIKSNTLRINFDTVKKDRQERVYTVEDGLCQQLEKRLRNILSERDLSEMNIVIYRCVNCTLQFSQENSNNVFGRSLQDVNCPSCKSQFVAEITDLFKTFKKNDNDSVKASPIISIFCAKDQTIVSSSNYNMEELETAQYAEDANSIGKGPSGLTATITHNLDTNNVQNSKSSANSLNGSSSCSRISQSHCSFDSNQSVVGSSNTDRETELQNMNIESDVDIISNPSQSSIEVLDQNSQYSSRKTSEERRISHAPILETINDQDLNFNQNFIEREFGDFIKEISPTKNIKESLTSISVNEQLNNYIQISNDKHDDSSSELPTTPKVVNSKIFMNLTESSSSGSITDSICTSYEQQQQNQKNQNETNEETTILTDNLGNIGPNNVINNLLDAERNEGMITTSVAEMENIKNANTERVIEVTETMRRADSNRSMFGAIFQSTNILMSSSKKLLDAESTGKTNNNNRFICQPYKFNYTDFQDVDHRLKLYFYQTIFATGEHIKWITKGKIYIRENNSVSDGLVVMSTYKCYVMEAFAPESDDITKWLKQVLSVTVDYLESIQILPWKIGLAFKLKGWGSFFLLLQDILRTDSLLLHFANDNLPQQCNLIYQPSKVVNKYLRDAVQNEPLKILSVLNGCEVSFESAKRTLGLCTFLVTDSHIYLSSEKLSWISSEIPNYAEDEVEICMTQLMSNLVDVERPDENIFLINFLDDSHGKYELWKCIFETKENAESCLNAIAQSWEKLFGVPLLNA